jgi:hypothetical protein
MISQATTARNFFYWYARQEARGTDCGYEKVDSADTNEGCAGHVVLPCSLLYRGSYLYF